jgi:hypothetical protein
VAGGVAADVGIPGVADVLGTMDAPDNVNGSDAVMPGVTQPLSVISWLAELCAADDEAGVCADTNADAAHARAAAPII